MRSHIAADCDQHWNTITGLPLEKQMMLDELAHGLVTPRSLEWICEMIRAEIKNSENNA